MEVLLRAALIAAGYGYRLLGMAKVLAAGSDRRVSLVGVRRALSRRSGG